MQEERLTFSRDTNRDNRPPEDCFMDYVPYVRMDWRQTSTFVENNYTLARCSWTVDACRLPEQSFQTVLVSHASADSAQKACVRSP